MTESLIINSTTNWKNIVELNNKRFIKLDKELQQKY